MIHDQRHYHRWRSQQCHIIVTVGSPHVIRTVTGCSLPYMAREPRNSDQTRPRETRARWRTVIGPARVLRFAKNNGAINDEKDQLALSSDDEDEGRSRRRPPSWRATPEPDTKRQHQHLSPPSREYRTSWSGLAGARGKGDSKSNEDDDASDAIF